MRYFPERGLTGAFQALREWETVFGNSELEKTAAPQEKNKNLPTRGWPCGRVRAVFPPAARRRARKR